MFVESILSELNKRIDGRSSIKIQPFQIGLFAKALTSKQFMFDQNQPQLAKLIKYFSDSIKQESPILSLNEIPYIINVIHRYDV